VDDPVRPRELSRELHAIWTRHLPGTVASIDCIGDAGRAILFGELDDAKRAAAVECAHQLVGVSAAYGCRELAQLARDAERLLTGDVATGNGRLLVALANRMNAALDLG